MEKKYYNKILLNKYYGKNYDFLQFFSNLSLRENIHKLICVI